MPDEAVEPGPTITDAALDSVFDQLLILRSTRIAHGALSVETPQAYVELAVALGSASERLGLLKAQLRRVHATTPLFDPVRFCRHLEAAFLEIHGRYLKGAAPAPLWVSHE